MSPMKIHLKGGSERGAPGGIWRRKDKGCASCEKRGGMMRREQAGRPIRLPRPPYRRLRVYAFDPSLDTRLETAVINQTILKVPWEYPVQPDSPCDPEAVPEPEPRTAGD